MSDDAVRQAFEAWAPDANGTRHAIVKCEWFGNVTPLPYSVDRDPGILLHPEWHSHAWFCPACGQIWLRERIEGGGGGWEIVLAPCGCMDYPYNSAVPGSITIPARYPLETFETLPTELQKREVTLLLEHATNGLKPDSANGT